MSASQSLFLVGLLLCGADVAKTSGDDSAKSKSQQEKIPEAENAEATVGAVYSAAGWLGRDIQSEEGKDIGRVEDFAFDLEDGCVGFVVVKSAKSPQNESVRIGLPLELLKPSKSSKTLSTKASARNIAEAPVLGSPSWADTVTRLWAADVYEYFGLDSPWKERQQLELWSPSAKYGRLFDPSRIKRIDGKITDVEYSPPLPGMSVGAELTVESRGRKWTVQMGPLWYLSRQDLAFKKGQEVQVTGSEIVLDKEPLLVATEIQIGKRRLKLREKDGAVVWQSWTSEDSSQHFVRMTELLNEVIHDDHGKEIGRIQDFAISAEGNRVGYAAVALHETADQESSDEADKLHAVPLGAFVAKPGAKAWVLELPEGIFANTPAFKRDGEWPQKVSRAWIEYVHVRYGRPAVGGVRTEERGETERKK